MQSAREQTVAGNQRHSSSRGIASGVIAALVGLLIVQAARAAEPVDFQQQIRPLLTEHCFQCHGPDEGARQAGLRLDVRDQAVAQRDSGNVPIVPGKPPASELVRRVSSRDPDVVMPPPDQKNPLKPNQIDVLRRWIEEGAPYSVHWAFAAPQRPAVLEVDAPRGVISNPIDNYVADRLSHEGLAMSPPAPHDVLCRRIHLDVIGLPPSPHEIDRFLDAAQEDLGAAVEALVERLLESEHFGEKWARHWLDVARYADTNGFEKDRRREQWAWRDWVIRAVNADMPYDRFVIEQIAGDLLPDNTQDEIVATGFLRNGMINEEGAIVHEQFRLEGLFDRMDCIGKAVLGLSIQCAQCHSHKFDPITQDEYYGMFAFLNDTYEAQSWVYTQEQQKKIAQIRDGVRAIEERLKAQRPDWRMQLAAWESEQRAASPKWEIIDPVDQVWPGGLNHPEELPDHSVAVLGHPSATGKLLVHAAPIMEGATGLRLEALTFGDLPFHGPGFSSLGIFSIGQLEVAVKPPGSDTWTDLPLKEATADFAPKEQPIFSLSGAEIDEKDSRRIGSVSLMLDGARETAWRPDRGVGRRNTESVAVVQFAEPATFPAGTQLRMRLVFQEPASPDRRDATVLGRARLALTKSPDPRAPAYDHVATLAMQKRAEQRTADEQAAVFTAWRQSVADWKESNAEIEAMWKQFPEAATSVLRVAARPVELHRETFLLDRGIWDKPKHQVVSHVPTMLHPLTTERPDRLAFARWLVDRRSPLAARVQVNRVWQAIFGVGLVETPEDFGTRAPQPEYLNLLDWLAVEFMDRGWSTKHLIRTVVSSATYQQSSRVTRELLEIDPQNRLLARGPRFRAEAEVVRDIALTASGLLNPKVGGPSIFPPVPETVLSDTFTKPDYWIPAQGPDRYRRSIYIFRKRSMPDPVLTSFDAPNADFACARRGRSNTPLAGLVSLNEPVFVEAARAMSLRILRAGGATDEQRANYAFRLCTGRQATPAERAEVLDLLSNRRKQLADGWLSINEVAIGDPAKRPAIPPNTTPQDAAAWTIAARVLLNLDETISKN